MTGVKRKISEMKKKFFALVTAVIMLITTVSCGSKSTTKENTSVKKSDIAINLSGWEYDPWEVDNTDDYWYDDSYDDSNYGDGGGGSYAPYIDCEFTWRVADDGEGPWTLCTDPECNESPQLISRKVSKFYEINTDLLLNGEVVIPGVSYRIPIMYEEWTDDSNYFNSNDEYSNAGQDCQQELPEDNYEGDYDTSINYENYDTGYVSGTVIDSCTIGLNHSGIKTDSMSNVKLFIDEINSNGGIYIPAGTTWKLNHTPFAGGAALGARTLYYPEAGAYTSGGKAPGGGCCYAVTCCMQSARGLLMKRNACTMVYGIHYKDHVYPVDYATRGNEAALNCSYDENESDLIIPNTTPYDMVITAWYDPQTVRGGTGWGDISFTTKLIAP